MKIFFGTYQLIFTKAVLHRTWRTT